MKGSINKHDEDPDSELDTGNQEYMEALTATGIDNRDLWNIANTFFKLTQNGKLDEDSEDLFHNIGDMLAFDTPDDPEILEAINALKTVLNISDDDPDNQWDKVGRKLFVKYFELARKQQELYEMAEIIADCTQDRFDSILDTAGENLNPQTIIHRGPQGSPQDSEAQPLEIGKQMEDTFLRFGHLPERQQGDFIDRNEEAIRNGELQIKPVHNITDPQSAHKQKEGEAFEAFRNLTETEQRIVTALVIRIKIRIDMELDNVSYGM